MATLNSPVCNLCGLSCELVEIISECGTQYRDNGGLIDATVRGGYASSPGNGVGTLDDCTEYNFSLCEYCLDYLFEQFKVPVSVIDIHDGAEPYRSAAERVKNDTWREDKETYFAEKKRRDEARKIK